MALLRIKDRNGDLVEIPTNALEMPILDLSDNFTSENVEGALREIGEKIRNGVATSAEIEALVQQIQVLQNGISSIVREQVKAQVEDAMVNSTQLEAIIDAKVEEKMKDIDVSQIAGLDMITLQAIIKAYKDGTLGSGGGINEARFYELLATYINVDVVNEMTEKYLNGELSGSGSGAVSPTIESEFAKETVIEEGSRVDIDIYFQTPNLGTGTGYITINGIEIDYYPTLEQGDNIIRIENKYLTKTTNTISIYVKDRVGMSSNKLTFKVISGGVSLTTTFDYTVDYVVGQNILFPFYTTTELSGEITLEMVIDGIPQETIVCANGYNSLYLNKYITGVGVHAVRMQAFIGDYHSTVLNFNVVISSSTQLILSTDLLEGSLFEYGNPIQVSYRISKLGSEVFTVEFYIDELLMRTTSVQTGNYYWTISGTQMNIGPHKLDIIAKGPTGDRASVSINIEIVQGEFTPIMPVDQGLDFDLDSDGYSNEQENRTIWVDKTGNGHNGELINFNFATNGWSPTVGEIDDSGNEVSVKYNGLVCNNNAYVKIPYKPFLENVINGYTFEIVYTPEHSGNEYARVLEYVDHNSPYTGVFIDILEANIKSESETSMGSVDLDYESGEIQVDFVIDRENKMCLMYINGILSRYWMLSDSGDKRENFAIDTDYIYINFSGLSESYCGGTNIVRKFRGYQRALTKDEIIQNYVANQPDLASMQAAYKWNYETQIPKLYIYGDISKCSSTNPSYVRVKYESPDTLKYGESFDMESSNTPFYLQGTSSLGYSRKNYRFVLMDSNGKEFFHKLSPSVIGESTFTVKCDYVDSSMTSNVCCAMIANDCIYGKGFTPAQKDNAERRTAIYGHAIELINVVDNEQESLGAYMFNIDRYATKNMGYDIKAYPNMICIEGESNSDVGSSAFFSYTNPESSGVQFPNEISYHNEGWRVVYPTINEDSWDFAPVKRLVDFVSDSSDDDFKDSFEQYFNKESVLKYYLFDMFIGGIDGLSKNFHLCSWDGQIFYVLPYDLDSCLGGTNTGYLRVPPSCEVGTLYDNDGTTILEENHFNSWNSKLWSRVRSTFNNDLINMWTTLRNNGTFTLDNILSYFEEIWNIIPPKMYNDSQWIKYVQDGAVGTVALHGNRKLQIKKWLRERMAYLDSKFGYYAGGGVNEQYVNFRMNYQGAVSLDISTYYTVYAKVRWATNNEQIIRIARGQKKTFSYYSDVGTDREVMIMLPESLKTIENISNIYPNSIDISKATKLTEIEAHNTNLYSVDLSKNKYLRKVDFNGCERLGTETATMTLNYCKYLNKVDLRGTQITAVTFNNKGGSLREIYYPTSIQSINLVNQSLLTDMILPYGDGSKAPIDLASINIENCPNISKLIDLSSDPTSLSGMKYCRNLTLNNSIKLNRFNFYGFTRLANVNLENMDSLEEVDFLNMTEVGQTSNLRYIGVSACPNMTTISMNVDNPNYEITWANDSILDLQTAGGVKNIYSNCIIKGLNTILLPITIENMYFTNEYGSGYSDIVNIWSPSSAIVSKTGVYPVAYHLNENNETDDYIGIDFKDLHLYNIDLGALVKIPNAINFSLYPTNANPNFNKNRDGNELPYLQPEGILDLSNYTESLARFFNGVDLNKLQLIVNKTLPQTDLSYCFYNSTFDNGDRIAPILENLISVSNMDYCFYKTSVSDISILNRVNFANGTSMKYCFAYCPNIIELTDITLSSKIGDSSYMFSGSGLTTVRNVATSSGNIVGFFSHCNNLRTVENFVADGTDSYESLFEGCSMPLPPIVSIPDNIVNIKNMYKGCPNLTSINDFVFHENLVEVEGFIVDCDKLINANNVTIAGAFYNDLFRGASSLKYINNLLITYRGRSMSFAHMFDGCTNLIEMSFHNDSYTEQVISMDYMFRGTSMKALDFSNVSFPKITSMKYMFADSYMREFTFTVPETITNITGFLSNCMNLRTLSNFIISTNVIVTDWLKDTNISTLIDCSFFNKNTSFKGKSSLRTVTNLTYTGSDFSSYFENCSNLQRATIIMENSIRDMSNSFRNCPNLNFVDFTGQSDLSNLTTIDGCFYGDSSLVSISNMKLTNPNTIATNITLTDCPINETEGLLINSNSALDMFRMGGNSKITKITEFNLGANAYDLHDLCMDYPLLISDFVIPSNVRNVQNLFKNCTSMESVTDNWNTLYDMNKDNSILNDVITTDCYSGCINAKYINSDLYVDEYGLPTVIKNIPVEWGGEMSFSDNKTVFDVKITEENLTYSLVGSVGEAKTNWGDGVEDMNITHTYSKPGIYIISTENVKTFATGEVIDSSYSSPIVRFRQLSTSLTKGSHLFDGWSNLIKIDGINHTLDSYYYLCNNCSSLSNDISFPLEATNVERAFYGCSNLLYATSNWRKSYNSTISHNDCYAGCIGITHIDGENIVTYEGKEGLDEIPVAWGGYEFTQNDTTVITVVIPEDNYLLVLYGHDTSLNTKVLTSWGDKSSDTMAQHTYEKAGTYVIKTKFNRINTANPAATLRVCATKILQVRKTNIHHHFRQCYNLTYVNFDNCIFDRPDVLYQCNSGNQLINMSCKNVTLKAVPWNSSNNFIFSPEDVKTWDISSLKSWRGLFSGYKGTSLDLSSWDAANITDCSSMFQGTSNLNSLTLNCDLSHVLILSGMFQGTGLSTIEGITFSEEPPSNTDVNQRRNMSNMFRECKNLKRIDIDIRGFCRHDEMFRESPNIEYIKSLDFTYDILDDTPLMWGTKNSIISDLNITGTIPVSIPNGFNNMSNLSVDCLLDILNALVDLTGQTAKTCHLGSTNLAKLTTEQIQIATNKGWTVI